MKKRTILLFLPLLASAVAFAQTVPALIQLPATKLEKFIAKKDTLVTTDSYYILRLSGDNGCNIRIRAIILYEAGRENEEVRGVKVEVLDGEPTKDARVTISYIDFDELEALSGAITHMLDMTPRDTALPNPTSKEMSFSTVGGLTLIMVQKETERVLHVTQAFQPESLCTVSRYGSIVELRTSIEKILQSFK
jgi:hypothetical protein